MINRKSQQIGPMDTAVFQIEVTNNYNLIYAFNFDIESVPDGWKSFIQNNIVVDANSKGIVLLSILPLRGFGYHNDIKIITVIANEDIPIPVLVESIGFSTIGIEYILLLIIPIFCISIIGYLLFKKKLKITEIQKR